MFVDHPAIDSMFLMPACFTNLADSIDNKIVLMSNPEVTSIKVVDSGDPLIDAEKEILAFDDRKRSQNPLLSFVRSELATRLHDAQQMLPLGYRLLGIEGYRPLSMQTFYFDRYRQGLIDATPTVSPEEADELASRFVSPPAVAPHVSGAAIDVTLMDYRSKELDLGTPVDANPEASQNACYFAATNISASACRNREILRSVLTKVGLVNYPTEWWHWSYGDRYWALKNRAPHALFGPVDR